VNSLLVIAVRPALRLWIGPQIVPSNILLLGMASWAVLSSVTGTMAMFLNGIGLIRIQATCSVLMSISNVIISIYLTRHIGVAGVIYGTILSQVAFILIPYSCYLPRLLADVPQGILAASSAPGRSSMAPKADRDN
jgi:O-antigen/teichoic acid export membrane protein